MDDLISVIVPVYNVENYIAQCIESVIKQTYTKFEIILVNDGSKDNSGKICDEYALKDERIKVIHKENAGVSSARNVGIKQSKGQWITFIDSDDWVEENYLEVLLNLAKSENADISICGYNRVSKERIEKINASGKNEIYDSQEYLIKSLNPQIGLGFSHMKLIKKSIIKDIEFNDNLAVAEDAFFNIQLSKNVNKAVHLMQPLYNYRNNSNSLVKKYDADYANKYLHSMKITKKYLFDNYTEEIIRKNYYNFVAYHIMLIAVNYCYHPDNPQKNRKKLLDEVCNYEGFKEELEKSNYENISITRKITLFTLKHKLYWITELICKYRQMQNRK